MGIPALEDGLFANLLIFDSLYVFRYSLDLLLEIYRLWEASNLFSCEISVECRQDHVWGPPGARIMS